MATIHVDGKEHQVDGADNLLQACLSLGLDIPYFCWHPALGSVGSCRQCAVKQFSGPDDKQGRLVMSCMVAADDNTWIAIDDAEAKAFRASVIEFLMTNHPHDCPVCEEGGNCHLQDMTVMSGHNTRRYEFTKRTHLNQDLGPFISHEMNRCIACYRCVRYYQDYAGGNDLGVFGAHNNVYFGRVADGVLENEFSGNLIEICPTGVFTDKTHAENYNRKWDMQFAPSICHQCAVGCNISPGERYGELRRIENRYHGAINHYFLCDRGRFGSGYVNNPQRPLYPQLRTGTEWQTLLTVEDAVTTTSKQLRSAKGLLGIGSPRASLEANFQLRELVGADNFYSGMNAEEWTQAQLILEILQTSNARTPSLREMENADAVLVLGEDVMQTAPRIALALRQASLSIWRDMAAEKDVPAWHAAAVQDIGQHAKNPLFIGSFAPTRLDEIASATYRAAPEDLARLGYAIAHAIDPQAPAVNDLDTETTALAQRIAQTLINARRPLLVSGSGTQSTAVLHAVANIAAALHAQAKSCELALVLPEVNSLGMAMLGGKAVEAALAELTAGTADTAIILENDLYQRCADTLVDAALQQAKTIIAIDHQATRTTAKATVLLSAASFAETDGTVVNNEGRAQRFFQVYDPAYYDQQCAVHESWHWLAALHAHMQGKQEKTAYWSTQFSEVTHACAQAIPALARIAEAAPDTDFRVQGLKVARSPKRYSGRTAMRAHLSVHEPRASQDSDSPLTFSMEGYGGPLEPGALTPFAWAPGWNSSAAWNKFQDEINGSMHDGDSGVRLLEPNSQGVSYNDAIPAAFAPQTDTWRVLPLYHIFGSDELSALAAPIQARIPNSYVVLNASDAQKLGIEMGTTVTITLTQQTWQFAVQIIADWPIGTIGIPQLPGIPVFTTWVEVTV